MRRAFGWMAGLVGIAALARVLARRRSRHAPSPAVERDPADELRRRLSQTRAAASDASGAPAAQEPSETLDERRSRVHAKAQKAIEAMQDTTK